jgi:hypothetical protein
MEFVYNLKYMGFGMLGILIVMGVIICSTYILNSLGNRLASGKEDKED